MSTTRLTAHRIVIGFIGTLIVVLIATKLLYMTTEPSSRQQQSAQCAKDADEDDEDEDQPAATQEKTQCYKKSC